MQNPYREASSLSPRKVPTKSGTRWQEAPVRRGLSDSDNDDDEYDDEYRATRTTRDRMPATAINASATPPPDAPLNLNLFRFVPKSARSRLLQILMFVAFVGCFVCAVSLKYVNLSPGIMWGSGLSFFSVVAVLISYASEPLSRQHPNPLVFWRTIADGLFVIRLLSEQFARCAQYECKPLCTTFNCGCATRFSDIVQGFVQIGQDNCTFFAGFFQFSLLASECWFLCMTLNLFLSLTNPFTDFKRNTKLFHMFSWGFALLTSVVLMAVNNLAGYSDFDTCWTNALHNFDGLPAPYNATCANDSRDNVLRSKFGSVQANYLSWIFFYVWILGFIVVGLAVWFWAWRRLSEGMPETYAVRVQSINRARFLVFAVSVYWTVVFIIYFLYLGQKQDSTKRVMKEIVNFLMASKGYLDLVIWFHLNDFRIPKVAALCSRGEKEVDVDLNPQVNAALRREVLFYTTSGIIKAVEEARHLPDDARIQHLALLPQMDAAAPVNSAYTKTFHDYEPHAFRRIRERFGVDNLRYLKSLSSTAKERLSEGASGAFMFFSGDGSLIVKSTSPEECNFLRAIADEYAEYLCDNPTSLLTRFYGCHCLELYGQQFSFVVMANLFDTKQTIHSRYDIKGSWVNRKGELPKRGKKVTCRHCNRKYVYQSHAYEDFNCTFRLGGHEPNIVLKDSDLTQKLKLDKTVALTLYRQLEADSDRLCRFGIMDYSLLMGVHDVEFTVDAEMSEMEPSGNEQSTYVKGTFQPIMHQMSAEAQRNLAEERKPLPRSGMRMANTVVGPAYYHLGVIDILQTWTFQKRMERFFKIHFRRVDGDGLSAIEPALYKKRFQLKMADMLGVKDLINFGQKDFVGQSSHMDLESSADEMTVPMSMRSIPSSMLKTGGSLPYITRSSSSLSDQDEYAAGHIHL
ncbi:phosphatidylinositol-4-phosphate-5-kinase (PIPK-D1/GPCR-PIPK) [Achlya hypogyna]|uniref:Phosphatidylinositol-4-phosphate-5-kinase (PIPK-D1/GPCR-PIPK) n=1 Tax=Achlya hypogyna TaxID=1202772 RepID=A0A1V9ZTF9_ACHHY|nr:phosphatidylinositol-4-phosphate-5-kinase (PIPK-D1/GPCR-PIPK) [Achlya hypogyna]